MKAQQPKILSFATVLVLMLASPATAKLVGPVNYGDQLFGANIDIHYSAIFGGTTALETGMVRRALIGNPQTRAATAEEDPNFTFSVVGETSEATWEVVNITAPAADPMAAYISKIVINLAPSRGGIFPSLFDRDSLPSTPNSGPGVLGITPAAGSTAPAPTSAVESVPWTDPDNLGDMYNRVTITWVGLQMIGPGQSFKWHDDTDLVVEAADFEEDGDVDNDDLAKWTVGFGTASGATHLQGDANRDEVVNGADFLIWQLGRENTQFQTGSVPEPGAFGLASLAAGGLAFRRTRRR